LCMDTFFSSFNLFDGLSTRKINCCVPVKHNWTGMLTRVGGWLDSYCVLRQKGLDKWSWEAVSFSVLPLLSRPTTSVYQLNMFWSVTYVNACGNRERVCRTKYVWHAVHWAFFSFLISHICTSDGS
jgi:hypothetical protein